MTATLAQLGQTTAWPIAAELRPMCVRALRRMYDTELNLFCFCIRRTANGDHPEGVSFRYTAITLLGLLAQEADPCDEIMGKGGQIAAINGLIEAVPKMTNLGDVALTLWVTVMAKHPRAELVLKRLRTFDASVRPYPTVEIAWTLTALSYDTSFLTDQPLAEGVADRLLGSFNAESSLFPHWIGSALSARRRAHVTCFADWVYPVQALSHYAMASGHDDALKVVQQSSAKMCELQGPAGQWWWHYDYRTGRVIERYPVYAVHQDGMAPMALFAAQDACGENYDAAIQLGLDWLQRSAERNDSLIDYDAELIWRKVARREPRKFVRGMQALLSGIYPSLRVPGVDLLFPPTAIDYECRPYHLGWLLYAFSDCRLKPSSKATLD